MIVADQIREKIDSFPAGTSIRIIFPYGKASQIGDIWLIV